MWLLALETLLASRLAAMGNDHLRLTMLPGRCSSTLMPYYLDGSLLAQERPECRSFSRNAVQPAPRLCSARIDRLSLLDMGGRDSQPGVQLLLARSTRHGKMGDAVVRRRRFGSRLRELNLTPSLNACQTLNAPAPGFRLLPLRSPLLRHLQRSRRVDGIATKLRAAISVRGKSRSCTPS